LHLCWVKIEICAASIDALLGAQNLKVDRVEVCSSLEMGGVTPSLGFIQSAMHLGLSTHVLLRPRPGGFVYSPSELDLIFEEIKVMNRLNVQGLVVGVLTPELRIDRKSMERIRSSFQGELTFHRAFDDLVEWRAEMDWLKSIGVNRILTSGLANSVSRGLPMLRDMVLHAKGQIQVMAGGGVNLANAAELLTTVKTDAIHFSATSKESLEPQSFFSEERLVFDPHKAKKLVDLCRNFS